MTLRHVYHAGGGAASPYDTWATAAALCSTVSAVAVDGDVVYVHPSHVETNGGSCTWAAGVAVICGTPDTPSGITAFQNTAQFIATNSNQQWNGLDLYTRGIDFKITGSSGSAQVTLCNTSGGVHYYKDCGHLLEGSGSGQNFTYGPTSGGTSYVHLEAPRFRWGSHGNQYHRTCGLAVAKGLVTVAGSGSPTVPFVSGIGTVQGGRWDIDGADLSPLGTSVKLHGSAGARSGNSIRICKAKMPPSWSPGTTISNNNPMSPGHRAELRGWSSGDSVYSYWIEDSNGVSQSETTYVLTTSPSTAEGSVPFSQRLTTLATCSYPVLVLRGEPIVKRVVAMPGVPVDVSVEILHDGAAILTNKQFWIEVEHFNDSGFATGVLTSGREDYLTTQASLPSSAAAWENDTGTGPNGTTTWHRRLAQVLGISILQDGYLVVTPCQAIPSTVTMVNMDVSVEPS